MAETSLTVVRRIKASPRRCYDAFTRPEMIARWWGPDGGPVLLAEADARVGGAYRIRFETLDGETHEMMGVYREAEPGRRLVFEMTWVEFAERTSLVSIDFAPCEGGTELTVHHTQLHDEETRASHLEGWNGMLDKLPALLLETFPERTADADA